jgi:hypothetical protein
MTPHLCLRVGIDKKKLIFPEIVEKTNRMRIQNTFSQVNVKSKHKELDAHRIIDTFLSPEQYYKVSSSYPSLHSTSILNLHSEQLQ